MPYISKETLRDKIYACWLGKNIGGTLGTPFEGRREFLDVKGFNSPEGRALPNDDLDLQLIWLKALEDNGPCGVNAQVLGEYWLNYIPPHWNEYGIGKCNMRAGLLPPLSGEYMNCWKHSNGAWIRSEIWACVTPGSPDTAVRYAVEDACVDHGMSEGTFAEMFTASVESAAFFIADARRLIDIGLSKIPEDCRVARAVRLAVDSFDSGLELRAARDRIVDDSADLGWFQAPANVAFVILGLLYGGGDFKSSLTAAVNCGDDTDCTGATLGALLGIMGGTAVIPEDWRGYIGDDIVSVAIDRGSYSPPANCAALTDRVMKLVPFTLFSNRCPVSIGDGGESVCSPEDEARMLSRDYARYAAARPAYSYDIDFIYARARVSFDGAPDIRPLGEIGVTVEFFNKMPDPKHLKLRWLVPDGFSVSGGVANVYLHHNSGRRERERDLTQVTLTAGERVEPVNRLVLEVTCDGRPTAGYIPVTLLG